MKRKYLSIILLFCLISTSFSTFAKKDELKLMLTKGQSFTYLITQENSLVERPNEKFISQNLALKINFTVGERLPNNNYHISGIIKSFGTEFDKFGIKTRYHSDTVDVRNKLYKTMLFLNDLKLSFELSPEGVVSNLKGFDVIKKKIEEDPKLNAILRSFSNEQYLVEFFHYIPQKAVEIGNKWTKPAILPELMNLKYDIQYSFKGNTEKEITLGHDADFKFATQVALHDTVTNYISETGTQVGTVKIDPKTRMPISTDIVQKILISTYQNRPPKTKVDPAVLTTKIKMTRVKK